MTATLLPFPAPTKCRVGSLAHHPDYGICDVIKVSGALRTVLYEVRVPDPVPNTSDLEPGENPEDILFSETISAFEAEVDVNALRELRLDRDLMKQPVSRILGWDKTRNS
jgi:hypothetical protein